MTPRAESEATSREGVPAGLIRNGRGAAVRQVGREAFDRSELSALNSALMRQNSEWIPWMLELGRCCNRKSNP